MYLHAGRLGFLPAPRGCSRRQNIRLRRRKAAAVHYRLCRLQNSSDSFKWTGVGKGKAATHSLCLDLKVTLSEIGGTSGRGVTSTSISYSGEDCRMLDGDDGDVESTPENSPLPSLGHPIPSGVKNSATPASGSYRRLNLSDV